MGKELWKRNIYLILGGQFLSGITSMIVQYAIVWYLTKTTGSATVLSFAMLLGMIPMIVLSPFVGPFVDRWNKKLLLVVPDMVAAAFAVILSVVGTVASHFPLWLIFVSLFVRAVAQTFQMPTMQSLIPMIVPPEQITKINGQLGMIQSSNLIIAPALGAFLYAIIPINYLILIDVFGALVGVGVIIFVNLPKTKAAEEPIRIFADTKIGFKKLIDNHALWYVTLIGTLFTLFFMPAATLYPLMTMHYFHGTVGQAGFVEMIYSVGMLFGGSVIGIWGRWRNRIKPIVISYLVIGITVTISGMVAPNNSGFNCFAFLNFLAGIATPFSNSLLMAMIQQSYPSEFLGRVLGVMNSLMNLAGPVGLIFAGPIADRLGVQNIFVIAGVATIACGLLIIGLPATRNYDLQLQAGLKNVSDN
ncbi:MFS transporter [Pediococcus claussenii]|uniref:Major Facilitator Superfamily protein n=1 Tax=Pediococcus claussenii (strain ATCC BAA-344 / DSM 14800 / JCM 18046 / KCTC 3811 / LMG 21948 / P06) TaxID=701521 RepID=G8PEG1_PEDCP|nr:MFS transporter [Pediococcus claussenii]AEV95570.1 major Facilitator Superfamily protein [Pediococcus claussenii ATCC BAA-344]ANZ69091.1 multidrug transporter [Pediococcus claussenii]ANZ70908.1 multidrug transporter [Pediococcus claussenii]KRN20196.1 hypothetical protein IV79_GL000863 [Pediococcus claussenii]